MIPEYLFKQGNNDQCLEYDDAARLKDSEAEALIESVANVINPKGIQTYEKLKRDEVIKLLKRKGLSIRQIESLTGVGFRVIRAYDLQFERSSNIEEPSFCVINLLKE